MARTAEGARLTQLARRLQLGNRQAALLELIRLWALVDPRDLRGTYPLFLAAAPAVVARRHQVAAELARRLYRAHRAAETGERAGEPDLPPPEPPPEAVVARAVGAAGLAGVINARRAGMPIRAAHRNGLVKVRGAATSLVMAGGRSATIELAGADGRATSWHRITSADPCQFCRDLAQETLHADPGAHFARHDTCTCTLEINF